ncbi:c-Myc-binding protein, partial [Tanacetum coccineum]
MEKEAKKEAFRKYLESSGVLDALTKVLVALYEQNDKPFSAVEFVQQKLGGPSLSEYEKLQAEMSDLQTRYNELLALHQEKCSQCKACGLCFCLIMSPKHSQPSRSHTNVHVDPREEMNKLRRQVKILTQRQLEPSREEEEFESDDTFQNPFHRHDRHREPPMCNDRRWEA